MTSLGPQGKGETFINSQQWSKLYEIFVGTQILHTKSSSVSLVGGKGKKKGEIRSVLDSLGVEIVCLCRIISNVFFAQLLYPFISFRSYGQTGRSQMNYKSQVLASRYYDRKKYYTRLLHYCWRNFFSEDGRRTTVLIERNVTDTFSYTSMVTETIHLP